MNDKELYTELNERIFIIKAQNYANIIKNTILPFVEDSLISSGKDPKDYETYEMAHTMFCNMKKSGKIDELNVMK